MTWATFDALRPPTFMTPSTDWSRNRPGNGCRGVACLAPRGVPVATSRLSACRPVVKGPAISTKDGVRRQRLSPIRGAVGLSVTRYAAAAPAVARSPLWRP
jgi:hypothetical protein